MSTEEGTFEPATLGATPSSADDVDAPGTNLVSPPGLSTWPMWLLGLVIMVDQIDQNIVRGIVTPLKEDWGISDAKIGILLSCFVLVNGLVTVPAGYLADRWNRTRTIGHTIVAWSGITAVTAAAPNFWSLVGIRSALGFGQGITEPSAGSLLADYYPADQRGKAFSIQQSLLFVGFGLGVGLGGAIGNTLGWRWAFLIVGTPGVLIAFLMYRLKEPARGQGERIHLGIEDDHIEAEELPLFDNGFGQFVRDMVEGLRLDLRTVWNITTMRYALVGVSALLFTITAVGAALPQFYERQLGVEKGQAEGYLAALVILAGIPGVLLGGRLADRFEGRVRGARMAIPAYCILASTTLIVASWAITSLPFAAVYILEILGFFIMAMSVPALRAGMSDALPANLRGAGFGAFNLCSVVFGQAAAPLIVFGLSGIFDDNLRTAFLICSPPIFLGGFVLLRAREHLEADAAKIFEAVLRAMQDQQEREAAKNASAGE